MGHSAEPRRMIRHDPRFDNRPRVRSSAITVFHCTLACRLTVSKFENFVAAGRIAIWVRDRLTSHVTRFVPMMETWLSCLPITWRTRSSRGDSGLYRTAPEEDRIELNDQPSFDVLCVGVSGARSGVTFGLNVVQADRSRPICQAICGNRRRGSGRKDA